ncbi:zinc-finger domain-containing protein [Thiosulfatimonas sediminis]|uniref:Zinc-finger domain-containing protein n=1 Tax=Thiosulfatimonas sediminis TaxID=2675054 RepID=A0A6F8PWY3_9GAMM|nr:zinc-finger domain-containing protein [Thiosulfatimonas sediminis]BBP46629.1 zinc-finger domain-containing protein [Thiosulfatimonas sediminis]
MSSNSTNSKKCYEVTHKDLPLHCPTPDMSKWNSHPRVYLPIEKTGKAKCPYCGADYILIDFDPSHSGGH